METRKHQEYRSSELPADYLKMVSEIFATNFDEGLKALSQAHGKSRFIAHGEIYPDEIVLAISLVSEGQLAGTTVHSSTDFDPKASSPTLEDLLSACVDAVGTFFSEVLDPKKPERIAQLVSESLSALENAPFEWTQIEIERFRVHLKVDKSNPMLEQMADEWLRKNDPDLKKRKKKEQEEVESLFITGEKAKKGSGSGTLH